MIDIPKKIIKRAEEIYEWASQLVDSIDPGALRYMWWETNLCGLCSICSYQLWKSFPEVQLRMNDNHSFNIYGNYIIDITFTQYSGKDGILIEHHNKNRSQHAFSRQIFNENQINKEFEVWGNLQHPINWIMSLMEYYDDEEIQSVIINLNKKYKIKHLLEERCVINV